MTEGMDEASNLSKKRKAPFDSDEQLSQENGVVDAKLAASDEQEAKGEEVSASSEQQASVFAQTALPQNEEKIDEETAPANPYDNIHYCIVTNDGQPDSLIKLIGLKQLFAKQLPKMPRAYIARLVFDRRHTSLAILSDDPEHKGTDDEIIGGICYRGFSDMRFAEIAFCAVNASHQVKVSFVVLTYSCRAL